jgi:2-C-methyl-D-erythritol 4-phosphate cytidylyltransferase
LLSWSLTTLARFGCDPLVVVVPNDHLDAAAELAEPFPSALVTAGGASRQRSVSLGLERVGDAPHVVVHDAARPFLSEPLLRRVLEGIGECDGAIAAEPVEETLKTVEDERVARTVDRSTLWRAQTPQAFVTGALRRAHERAPDADATDDAQLVELAGGTIAVVRGERHNIKVTYDEDFEMAESIAARLS